MQSFLGQWERLEMGCCYSSRPRRNIITFRWPPFSRPYVPLYSQRYGGEPGHSNPNKWPMFDEILIFFLKGRLYGPRSTSFARAAIMSFTLSLMSRWLRVGGWGSIWEEIYSSEFEFRHFILSRFLLFFKSFICRLFESSSAFEDLIRIVVVVVTWSGILSFGGDGGDDFLQPLFCISLVLDF